MRNLVLCVALALGAGVASAAGDFGFDLEVSLTPMAAETLGRTDEGIVVSAWWYADPKAGADAHTNPVGLIDIGFEEHELEAMAGTVRIGGAGVDTGALAHIGGPVMVNVNVYSARRAGPDNVLDCDFFDGPLTNAMARPVALRCGLIEEHIKTEAKS
jgi:hypothetical protein